MRNPNLYKQANPLRVTAELHKIMKIGYRTIASYRVLPPKWKIVGEEREYGSPADRYLRKIDESLHDAHRPIPYGGSDDIVSLVFANQSLKHELTSRQLAEVIEERRALNEKHLRDVKWRLHELLKRKPLRPRGPGFYDDHSLTEVERQILDLEKQNRALELTLWRDTHELRASLVEERRERHATNRRLDFLGGEQDGRS